MIPQVIKKFSTNSRQVLKRSWVLAQHLKHQEILPEHLLYSLSLQKGSLASEILFRQNLSADRIKALLFKHEPTGKKPGDRPTLGKNTKKIVERAVLKSSNLKHSYVGTEHLLAALIDSDDIRLKQFLKKHSTSVYELHEQVNTILNSTSKFPDFARSLNNWQQPTEDSLGDKRLKSSQSILDLYAVDLTDPVIQKDIDPVISREEEIERLIQILSRRTKNNPILLGDPGIGKTAIVEGLAKKIVNQEVPEALENKKIFALDLTALVAGTSFRGDFEGRMQQLIYELKENPNLIVFIDEIHTIVGTGSASGSMDAANILKPALAKGHLRCIGATTLQDFKKYIETDPALERRFQPVMVAPPDHKKAVTILNGIKHNYQIFHNVEITEQAITAAVKLSERYIQDKSLPDKAIDLIDEAAARVKVSKSNTGSAKKVRELQKELEKIQNQKRKAVLSENYNEAHIAKKEEAELKNQISALKNKQKTSTDYIGTIEANDIAEVVARITKIPLHKILAEERKQILNLDKILAKKVIGQEHAIKTVSELIKRSRAGVTNQNRPIGSFLFLGPTGVGKTFLAKALAEQVFGSPDNLIRIDMSEFSQEFNISKLIGSPAGYVGYKDSTKLTDLVKQKPYSLVLFDEIEKAHREIFNLLLQILEDGQLTDATGRAINFKNTIIIMTSNLGSDKITSGSIGFDRENFQEAKMIEHEIAQRTKDFFSPEFLNRVDKQVIFYPLSKNALQKIVAIQLSELKNRLEEHRVDLNWDKKAIQHIAQKCQSIRHGAREVRRYITHEIESEIAEKMLQQKNLDKIPLTAEENKIKIK
ncbi:MAG: ATP-dependent Clp protease ATP-binding subunit ClpC [Candidatus Buchananbacteria bacterium CG10_big_fil_rev_8_21_14_0_10_42_9]|uniref:ATP-dependent Clp protease ATP-binding subunit ClpC n=1 Tax=Candidatus Buchananbacteria bacterium CG10_big_fil_rev_8_21_14_0_10_42_9 TaxID=1974526 RepID=A0A2H0W0P8_9BACT|nr:MAG: ATP-dependent Clp protease ATP-binding subunit ClpC [Candidatus Buchananbacteria bacterium CG10_big_fil_rev_8_21_14_0_10_42_9]